MNRIITLTTDFGSKDHYVGAMKGAILSTNPDARIVDATHEIPQYDIMSGAFAVKNFYRYFPEGSIHLAVVDPGVGSRRKPLAISADGNIFIGPDNGIFTFVIREAKSARAYEISNPKFMLQDVSRTFHGRDIFAPAAAWISMGIAPSDLGEEIKNPVEIAIPEPKTGDDEIVGEVIHADSFGNLITNIPSQIVNSKCVIYAGDAKISGISASYSDTKIGEILAICGSSGFLEISVNRGSAAERITGKTVRVKSG